MTTAPVFALAAGTQSYDWGKVGRESKAAQYALNGIPGFTLDESKPYAELWMGTHPTLPSRLTSTPPSTLAAHLAAHPTLVGPRVPTRFPEAHTGNLPFLFKILAIRKALSIQAHPDKPLAERLHVARPDLYKDANHKPEMAIALTRFTALCGFRPLCEIATYLACVPELAALVPTAIREAFHRAAGRASEHDSDPAAKTALRDVFAAVMTAPAEAVAAQVRRLVGRYKAGGGVRGEEESVRALAVELDAQFPDDVGVLCVFLLNVVMLQPGEAIFLGAGEPHAYVAGDIVETMATSDNVLRAGLTPKTRDVPNLVASLTYRTSPASAHTVVPAAFARGSAHTRLYDPPIPEFAVLRAGVPAGKREAHGALEGPSVLIVTEGRGRVVWGDGEEGALNVGEGAVVFVGAGAGVAFEAAEELVLYRAFVEV